MLTTSLHIKNMVCPRCIAAIESLLKQSSIDYTAVKLGEVILPSPAGEEQLQEFTINIAAIGFELLDNQKQAIINTVKSLLIAMVQSGEIDEQFCLSDSVEKHLHKEYSSISKLFTQQEGITLEQFFILQRIEKVKEWLVYNEFSLSEIAFKLGYSSVAYLSNQF